MSFKKSKLRLVKSVVEDYRYVLNTLMQELEKIDEQLDDHVGRSTLVNPKDAGQKK